MTASLYEMSARLRSLLDAVAEAEGEVDEEQACELDALGGDLTGKVDACLRYAQDLLSASTAAKLEAQRLSELASAREKKARRLHDYVRDCLEVAGQKRLSTGTFECTVCKAPERVEVANEGALPPRFWRYREPPPPQPDKKTIVAALKGGEFVPGAILVRGPNTLRVR